MFGQVRWRNQYVVRAYRSIAFGDGVTHVTNTPGMNMSAGHH